MASGDEAYIDVDGSLLEGGGQILRMTIVFSALLKKRVHVFNIRGKRTKPGLRPQHMSGLQVVRDICCGQLRGDTVGSMDIYLSPGAIRGGSFSADTKTAGSISLLIQVSLPCLLFAKEDSHVQFRGGTNTDFAPQMDYITEVLRPMLTKFRVTFECDINRRGYYPKGGGEVVLHTQGGQSVSSCTLTERGSIDHVTGRSWVAGVLPLKVSQAMAQTAQSSLKSSLTNVQNIEVQAVKEPAATCEGTGNGIILVAKSSNDCVFGGSALGKRGVRAEDVGQQAAQDLLESLKVESCVDQYMQDQLIVFMALAEGVSRIRTGPLTLHTKTAIFIAEMMSEAKFSTEEHEDGTCTITCNGIGFKLD